MDVVLRIRRIILQGRGSGGGRGLGIAAGTRLADFCWSLCVCGCMRFFRSKMDLFECRDLGRFWVALGVLLASLGSLLGRSWGGLGGSLGEVLGGVWRLEAVSSK